MRKTVLWSALLGALSTAPVLGAQTQPEAAAAPAASPGPSSVAPIIGQLRLIGTVKAKTRFCSALETAAASAAGSSIQYEAVLYRTAMDFQAIDLDDPLHKQKSMRALDTDVRMLGILATTGRHELEGLRHTGDYAPAGGAKAAVAVRDALDGAKARQYELAKQLAVVVSRLANERLFTSIDLPADNVIGSLHPLKEEFFSTRQDKVLSDASRGVILALPENDHIVQDLQTAATNAQTALKSGNC